MATPRLKAKDIKAYRERQIKRQKGVCPLCGEPLVPEDATLDHCHDTGRVRMALHRSCNGAEGRIYAWAGRRSRGDCPETFLKNLISYWKRDFSSKPIHPTHGQKKRRKRRPIKRKRNARR